ncbi:MAG TPA: AAA family ATPase [Chloroflexota bacterium]|nr:AAA family ATPase [Chloroflexota bacterium]
MTPDESLVALRHAVRLSPDNLPLRHHVADLLLQTGLPAEAETEYRAALALNPPADSQLPLKTGLAAAFYQQGKYAEALVVLEDAAKSADMTPRGLLLHARLLHRMGELPRAAMQYRRAIELEPDLADPDLAAQLNVGSRAARTPESTGPANRDSERSEPQRLRWNDVVEPLDTHVERPAQTFADVGGLDALKEDIRLKIIHPLTHPDLYRAYGKPVGGGILMYGPPGCGKTHLARATAGEIRAGFLSVGLNDVLDMWIGQSEKNLHALFEQARASTPCVLFFDEVDALGAARTDMRKSGGRQLINQFLSELDGVQTTNEGVLVLAATNAPWHLDPAFRRPGRFDRVIFVPPPDAPARAAIVRVLLRGKPVRDVDAEQIARKTDGFSGADLKGVVDTAVETKLRAALRSGTPDPLTTRDLLEAAGSVKPTTKEWFATARNYALYANEGGAYDDVVRYMKLR